MKRVNKLYIFLLIMLIFTLVPMIILCHTKNALLCKKSILLKKLNKKSECSAKSTKNYGYYDILKFMENNKSYKLLDLSENNNLINARIQYSGKLDDVYSSFKAIGKLENFSNIGDTEISKKGDEYFVVENVLFKKSK